MTGGNLEHDPTVPRRRRPDGRVSLRTPFTALLGVEVPIAVDLAAAFAGVHDEAVTPPRSDDTPAPPADDTPAARWSASAAHPDMWVDPDADPRFAFPEPDDERTTLVPYLAGYRLTMEMKCAGLDAEQLARRSVPPSTMSLLGIVRHMAGVEQYWFRQVMAGEDAPRLYRTDEDRDLDWNGAVGDPDVVAEAWGAWRCEVAFAERFVESAEDLGVTGRQRDGTPIQLRSVLVHMVEEYARHCGHADLLRERIDGRVGA